MDSDDPHLDDFDEADLSPLMQALMPKMTPCRIREFEAEDADACLEIFRSNETRKPDPQERQAFADFLAGDVSYFLVVEHDGDLIGCGGVELVGDPDSATFVHTMIHREYQRRGFGSALLAAQISLVEAEDRPIDLWTDVCADAAGFYQNLGFEPQHGLAKGDSRWLLCVTPEDIQDARAALLDRDVQLVLSEEDDAEDDSEVFDDGGDYGSEEEEA